MVAEACNARVTGRAAEDVVLFCGSGTTAAVNKLVHILGLHIPSLSSSSTTPSGMKDAKNCESCEIQNEDAVASGGDVPSSFESAARPVVFVGPMEHHSNLLPWRESAARVVSIKADPTGPNGK